MAKRSEAHDPRDQLLMATAKAVLHIMDSRVIRGEPKAELEAAMAAMSEGKKDDA